MVAIGEDRYFAEEAIQTLFFAELGSSTFLNLEDFDGHLLLCLQVQGELHPGKPNSKDKRRQFVGKIELTLRIDHGR